MAVTHKLRIGFWNITITNLSRERKEYKTVDKDNKELDYVPGKVERGYYINPDTKERVLKVYKRIGEKPADKLKRTEGTDKYKEVEAVEVDDLLQELTFLVEDVPNELMEKLKVGKAIKTIYTPGNGYSSYYGYVRLNTVSNEVEMVCGDTFKSKQILAIKEAREGKKKFKEVTLQEDGVQRADAEEILAL